MSRTRPLPRPEFLLLASSVVGLVVCIALASVRLRGLLTNSALLTGGALAVSVVPGTFLAVMVAKSSMGGRRVVEGVLVAMLFVPLYVQAAAWQTADWFYRAIGQEGWLIGWRGAIWVHGVAAIPWVVLAVGAALRNVPRELEEEALQDVSAWRVVLQVSLRRAAVGVVAASLWIAVICFGEIAVTDLFQIRTFAEEVYTAASLGVLGDAMQNLMQGEGILQDVPQLAAGDLWLGTLAVLMLVLAALGAIKLLLPKTERVSASERWIWQVRGGRVPVDLAAWMLVAGVVAVPVVSLLVEAGSEIRRVEEGVERQWSARKAAAMVLESPREHRRELRWSFTIGGWAAVAATGGGLVIAWALRTRRLPSWPTALLLALGFSIPGPLLAVWVIQILNQPEDSIWSPLAWCYDYTILAPVLVQFLRALPLATLVLWSQLASLPQDVLDSAVSEGAGWWRRLIAVAFPLRWPAVVAAGCMSLIVAMSDLAATLLVAPPGVATLSMRIFGLLHYGAEDRVAALCLALGLVMGGLAMVGWGVFSLKRRS